MNKSTKKKYLTRKIIIFFMGLVLTSTHVFGAEDFQSLEVYQQNGRVKVRGQIDFKELFASDEADKAIQFAVDALKDKGGEILVHSGRYVLKNQIDLESGIALRGKGSGTIFVVGENHMTGTAFHAKEKNRIVISDFSIKAAPGDTKAQIGIALQHCGDCTVKDVFIVGMNGHGIKLYDDSFLCEIRGAKIANPGISGILLENLANGGRGGDFVPNLVTNCIIYGGRKGIECNRAIVVNIVACEVYQTESYGFHIRNTSNSVLLSGCRTYQISDDAVVVESSHEINITGNIICWHSGHGVVLSDVVWGTVTGNNIIDSGSINLFDPSEDPFIKSGKRSFHKALKKDQSITLYNGVYLKSGTKGLTVSANAIFNWPAVPPMKYGIEEDITCFSNLITGNNINFCEERGVLFQGKNSKVVNNIVQLEEPYLRNRETKYHMYDTRLIQSFIEELQKF